MFVPRTLPVKLSLGDLTTPIHPIFRRWNFIEFKDDEYDLMRPGLQLASRLIRRPTPLSFWHTIIKGEVEEVKYPMYPLGESIAHYEYIDHPAVLTQQQAREVEAKLISFAEDVQFAVDEEIIDKSDAWVMQTCLSEDESDVSTIKIPRPAISDLEKAATKFTNDNDETYYIVTSFLLARTLIHELAHAVYHLHCADDDYYYFPGYAVDEVGFTWENDIFGGLIHYKTFYQNNLSESYYATIVPWPNARLVARYIHDDDRIGLRYEHSSDMLPSTGELGEDNNGRSCVPFSYLRKLFMQAFWTQELVAQGPNALQPGYDQEDWVSLGLNPQLVEVLSKTYTKAKANMKAIGGEDCATEQRELCEPWEQFLAEWSEEADDTMDVDSVSPDND